MAEAGARIAVADLDQEAAAKIADDVDGAPVFIDVTDPESVAAAVAETEERLGSIDICVNCAGWERATPFLETDEDFTQKVLEINLAGPIRVTREVLGAMSDRVGGGL